MVVGGEERLGAQGGVVVDVLDHRPGDGDAVVGAGAAADLVQDEQAAGGGVVQDVGGLDHLDHEGGLPGVDLVLGADAGEDAVDEADAGGGGGDEAAHLRHQDDQGDLAQVGGLAGHVGAGDDAHALAGLEGDVVGHEALAAEGVLDHRVAAVLDVEHVVRQDLGADVAAQGSGLGEGGQDIQLGQAAGGAQQAGGGGAQALAHLAEQAQLDLVDALLGVEHQRLVFLHLGGDVALGVDQGLLADVVGGRQPGVGAGDLDVIAEDLVVADLEGLDAGALALDAFQVGDPLAGMAGALHHPIQLGGEAGADDAGVGEGGGRVIGDGGFEQGQLIGAQVEVAQHVFQAGAGSAGADRGQAGVLQNLGDAAQAGEGLAHGDQVARLGGAAGYAVGQAFQVVQGLEGGAQLGAQQAAGEEEGHALLALADVGDIQQRLADPLAQQALAHGGDGVIQLAEQRAVDGAAADGLGQLQVAAGGGVEGHELGELVGAEAGEQLEGGGLGFGQVLEDGAGGADGGGQAAQAKAIQ